MDRPGADRAGEPNHRIRTRLQEERRQRGGDDSSHFPESGMRCLAKQMQGILSMLCIYFGFRRQTAAFIGKRGVLLLTFYLQLSSQGLTFLEI